MDSGFCAWQFSQTPDSLACSPAAAASSGLYWVTIDPPSKKTSSLLSSSLTLSKPMAACSAMNARTAAGPVGCGCGPSGPIRTGLLSRSNEAARIRGPVTVPAAIWSRRNTSVGTGVSDPAEYALVNPWSSMIAAFRLAISRCSSGVGMWWKKLTSSGGLNDGSMCPSAEGNVRWQCESTRPGMTVRPAQSTTWSPGSASVPPPTLTDSITEPRSTTSAGTGGAPEPSKTVPLTKRVRWPGDCEGTGASGMSGSDHVVPAVGHKIAAGDVIGVLAGQEERGAGHLFRLGDVVHRGHRAQRVAAAVLVVLAAQHPLGLHEPGCEHVDPHLGREGVRVGLGEADDAVLGGGVLRRPGAAAHDDGRADVDDRPSSEIGRASC